ncbi:hypothetical protein [Streptomyces sp. Ag109_O5-1]|uniref:hypothetical protein n=1 Tax=Streptomyces sp. Ag109_O5-1 TaxID=1938851 RepID=UPI0037D9ED19
MARAWVTWEDAVIAHEALGSPGAYSDRPDDSLMAFVRICAPYFAQDAFLEDGHCSGTHTGWPGSRGC